METKWIGLAGKLAMTTFHWAHQGFRMHNLKHEKGIFDKGIKDIYGGRKSKTIFLES